MPKMPFSWETVMVIAAADVKPAITGPDMKSIRKPGRSRQRYVSKVGPSNAMKPEEIGSYYAEGIFEWSCNCK